MQLAPTGIVTIACSDIEGSTPLWSAVPDAMKQALELHDRILRSLIERHNGYEFSAEGDAFKVAFSTPGDALRWCSEVQEILQNTTWPAALLDVLPDDPDNRIHGLRVRIGVHTGEPVCRPHPLTQRMDYFGPVVNLSARVGHAPHGGQIVISKTVLEALDELPAELERIDLGTHHLRGVAHPVHLHQVLPRTLADRRFPALRTLVARRTNLVARPSSFVGRSIELKMLESRLRGQETRLLTLLGPGGTGKTRLSQQAGLQLTDHFGGGVWFCDLTEARDLDGICAAVAGALSMTITTRDPVTQLGNAILGRGPILMILDNFEQVVDLAHSTVGTWLMRAPEARFLVSSRERLGLEAEVVQDLDPLPSPEGTKDWATLIQNPGVLLFVERARQVRQDFQLDEHSIREVAQIVHLLDGLPLAIELAAGRSRTLRPDAILNRLRDEDGLVSLNVLQGRSRDRQARQATIRGAIQWSWDLLEPWEKSALAQCAVFVGGFDMEAAEAVIDLAPWSDAPDVDIVIEELVDQSLIRQMEPAELVGESRFAMLLTIQSFAKEHLVSGTETDIGSAEVLSAAIQRHADWYGRMGATDSLASLDGTRSRAVLPRLMLELGNFGAVVERHERLSTESSMVDAGLAAMELYHRQGPPKKAIEVGEILLSNRTLGEVNRARLMLLHGRTLNNLNRMNESRILLEKAHDIASRHEKPKLAARAMHLLSVCFRRLPDHEKAEEFSKAALELTTKHDDQHTECVILIDLGALYLRQGRFAEAKDCLERAVPVLRATDQARQLGMALQNLGHISMNLSEWGEARHHYQAALALQQQVGAHRTEAAVRGSLASLEVAEGRPEVARKHYETALQIQKEVGVRRSEGILHGNLAELLLSEGELEAARRHLNECLLCTQETGARQIEGAFLGSLGELELRCGRLEEAEIALVKGEERIREVNMPLELAKLLCRRATLEEVRGRRNTAQEYLAEVETLCEQLQLGANSTIRKKVQEIRVKIRGS